MLTGLNVPCDISAKWLSGSAAFAVRAIISPLNSASGRIQNLYFEPLLENINNDKFKNVILKHFQNILKYEYLFN